jgi:hypothetical protein
VLAVQGVEPVPEALGVNDDHRSKPRPVAGGLLEPRLWSDPDGRARPPLAPDEEDRPAFG